ncbi:MAG: hypothetical protein WC346_09150 [Methanogenium sp.]|jgi:hypothetical protein
MSELSGKQANKFAKKMLSLDKKLNKIDVEKYHGEYCFKANSLKKDIIKDLQKFLKSAKDELKFKIWHMKHKDGNLVNDNEVFEIINKVFKKHFGRILK